MSVIGVAYSVRTVLLGFGLGYRYCHFTSAYGTLNFCTKIMNNLLVRLV